MTSSDRRFMVDEDMLEEIVGYATLNAEDSVLEVGAGSGNLTEKIAAVARVCAIEKERKLFETLKGRVGGSKNATVMHGDALKLAWPPYNKVVSNIPYSISRRLLQRFVLEGFELAVLVVQKEFAKKLCAAPGTDNYRMVSVLARSACDVEFLKDVPPDAFRPRPRVDSAVVRLRQRWKPPADYLRFLNMLFSKRNKMLKNVIEAPGEYGQMKACQLSPDEIKGLFVGSHKG